MRKIRKMLHFGTSDRQVFQGEFAWQVQGQHFKQMHGKSAQRIGTRPAALHSTFRF